ncbi:MAG: ThiS family [Clostridia bacterium]|nr:ThiS family [Clostridia bacterium]
MCPKTITITIKFVSHLAAMAGREEEAVTLPAGNGLLDLLRNLAQKYGPDLAGYFLDPETGDLWPGVAVVVNNRLVASLKEAPALQDGDEVMLIPGAEGG